MDNSVFILCKQNSVRIERLHICTWDIDDKQFFTEYGFEINRNSLKKLNVAIALPAIKSIDDFKCLFQNISEINNCRFIFNSDIEEVKPINGNPRFGNNVTLTNNRQLAILPIQTDLVTIDNNILKIELDIPDQSYPTIYFRFLVKSEKKAFIYINKEISKKIINYDIRINECRTASPDVCNLQTKGYIPMPIQRCFCFHIIPNTYNIDFINSNKLKTIRSLEFVGFNQYLGEIKDTENISLKEHLYNIVFCKQENLSNYSFFSVYSKDYIGDVQIILAIAANLICSLLFAAGALHTSISDPQKSYWERIPIEYWSAVGILILLIVYFGFKIKNRK